MPSWQTALISLAAGLVLGIIIYGSADDARASIDWQCQPIAEAMADIEADGFHMIGGGVTGNQRGWVAFFVAKGGRWIATLTQTNGMTCIQGRGQGWQGEAPCWGNGI